MTKISLLLPLLASLLFSLEIGDTFESHFVQTVTDEKAEVITYEGNVLAAKPQNALWSYQKPISKDVYVNQNTITIVEPEIEQVIVKQISSDINLFELIKNAKKISETLYETVYMQKHYRMKFTNELLQSISYQDEFDNNVSIVFSDQQKNKAISEKRFFPIIPLDFDVISE